MLLGEGAAAADFSRTVLSISLGSGIVVSGILAPLVGAFCDVVGPQRVFLAGAVLGALGLAFFSQATEEWQVIIAWTFLVGPAMACTLYEPAYVTIDQWFDGPQGKPLGALALMAGVSVTIFLPFTQWLVGSIGWREATLTLGVIMLTVVGTLALLVVRDRPRDKAETEKIDLTATYVAMIAGLRRTNRTFWLIGTAYFFGLTAMFAMMFHQVAYLQDLGFPPAKVAAAVGLIGVVSLPGRFLIPMLGDYVSPSLTTATLFGMLALSGLTLFDTEEWWRVYLYLGLFGVVFGAVMPMRPVIMSQYFSGAFYGRLMGLQAMMLALAKAGGPLLTGLLRDTTGAYAIPWLAAVTLLLFAIPAVILATWEKS